ncbi:MAG: hypothetical protein LBH11_04850 [Propionibacteriaceae bacterium]|jgi:hypothetical protein|nr:hypothetical protein [Propionibacteriaceae bacterium]
MWTRTKQQLREQLIDLRDKAVILVALRLIGTALTMLIMWLGGPTLLASGVPSWLRPLLELGIETA